ncbi:hypothetical protein CANCADRAFT_122145 [Tortispora caseinolytica NRRL Y-17796]|uniref:Uncharacterized protein n=1 Tax=Tortispora caseinolytica NRRL Y-17796 TaxID=767744 RepID=A0A1E4THR7_9ASCO|nr:hypothetical protein CANCADRAFT_122145 [Tortispora caseinolytica NRRL Y-17796]
MNISRRRASQDTPYFYRSSVTRRGSTSAEKPRDISKEPTTRDNFEALSRSLHSPTYVGSYFNKSPRFAGAYAHSPTSPALGPISSPVASDLSAFNNPMHVSSSTISLLSLALSSSQVDVQPGSSVPRSPGDAALATPSEPYLYPLSPLSTPVTPLRLD